MKVSQDFSESLEMSKPVQSFMSIVGFSMARTSKRRVQLETAWGRQLEETGLNKGHTYPACT